MAALEFPCPHCSLTLRARDRTVAGTTIVCPDCESELLIEEEGNGILIARAREVVSPFSSQTSSPSPPQLSPTPERESGVKIPPRIWGLGSVCLILLVLVSFWLTRPDSHPSPPTPDVADTETAAVENDPLLGQNVQNPHPDDRNLIDRNLFQEPLALMQRYLDATGRYPAPSMDGSADPSQRFGWIARLETFREPDRLEPLWDRRWDDPLNEHFVRRSLPHWINPAINPKTSPNRFPATHFVGVAGVGQDAADLPRSHERAGIFGTEGTASLDHLGDGAANVWMMSGVQREIGSWAAGGRATIRPWTRGPIIGGPDGFGTGNPDSMPILMADGSVRTISADTDPAVLSKLAAVRSHRPSGIVNQNQMAGTLPREKIHGSGMPLFQIDPLRAPKPPEAALAGLLASLQKDLQAAANQPEIDVEKQLAQKLLLFDQPNSLPVRTLLDQLQELSAVPIEIDTGLLGDAADRLDDRVRISLIEPTLKQLLEKLLYRAKLGYRIERGKIVITPDPLRLKFDDLDEERDN